MTRLKGLPTLHIEPGRAVAFTWRGRTLHGVAGDTIATAMFAEGVRVFGRSLKYHRPRGLYSLDGESANTLVEVDGVPNVRAESAPLAAGMTVKPQNVVGSPELDLMGGMDLLGWAMPAGFYYRVFHKPARIWPTAIKQIRRAAGVGKIAPDFRIKGRYDEVYLNAEVCVIGGGPAGMSAALAAADAGQRVILLESRPRLGGAFEYRAATHERVRGLTGAIDANPLIRAFTRTPALGVYTDGQVTACRQGEPEEVFDQRYMEIRARRVVVATGCIERPLLFENNERPGVMQADCALRLARTWGILAGREAVFSVGHDQGLEAAIDLSDLGLKIALVADTRPDGHAPHLVAALAERRIPFLPGWTARTAHGSTQVRKVTLCSVNGRFNRVLPCDLLVASAGLTPVNGPLTLAEAKLAYDPHTGFFLPASMPEWLAAAGRMLGLAEWDAVAASGRLAGLRAAAACGAEADAEIRNCADRLKSLPGPARGSKFVSAPRAGAKAFICFDEDTTLKNIDQAMDMGFDVPELIKRFTSAGTGPSQGGIPGHNLPLYVSQSGSSPDPQPRPTLTRPPLVPTLMAAYAGPGHAPVKRTPLHDLQTAEGGRMETVGDWRRARRFSEDRSCRDEIRNVRTNVGLLDASTLGKFRLFGPDALKALQRVYVSDMARMHPGRAKYSAMCNDDGCLADDGVVVRTGDTDYYFTTSTGRAGVTAEWIRFHTRFDGWDFGIVNLTDAYGVINIAGPNSRVVLGKITAAAVDNASFPYMGYREFEVGGVGVRALRLGFVGELSYELHVPSSRMAYVWGLLLGAGKEFGIRNFGLEAQNALRLDKGHIIIGSESEQRTTLHDLGLGFLWHREKPAAKTVGDIALRQTERQAGRLKLVGFKMEAEGAAPPRDGSPVVDTRIRGYVCTARASVALGEAVGLALVDDELAAEGTRLAVYEDDCRGRLIYARVTRKPFYDPQGEKLRS